MLKIILACMYQDFGQSEMAPDFSNASWEYDNIYKPLQKLHNDGIINLIHTHWVNINNNVAGFDKLLSIAKDADLIFQVGVNHGLSICKPHCNKIIEHGVPIVDYPPDIWARFDHHSPENWIVGRFKESYVTHYITAAKHVIPLMKENNLPVYYMPFGIADCFTKLDEQKIYDVSFIGQAHGIRKQVMQEILKAGIKVSLWGHYWDSFPNWHGRPGYNEVNKIINQSKINLNFRWTSRSPDRGLVNGRSFELLGAGAFMIGTKHAETDDFHEMYTPDVDFVERHYVSDLIDAIKYYLKNDTEREQIAANAYKKREQNTWESRFRKFIKDKPWTA